MNYLIDTNIIKALMKNDPTVKINMSKKARLGKDFFICGINYFEVKRGLLGTDAPWKLQDFEKHLERFKILLLDKLEIFDKASEIWEDLRRKGKIEAKKDKGKADADILIAATGLVENLKVVTDNEKHFKDIENIELENWLRN